MREASWPGYCGWWCIWYPSSVCATRSQCWSTGYGHISHTRHHCVCWYFLKNFHHRHTWPIPVTQTPVNLRDMPPQICPAGAVYRQQNAAHAMTFRQPHNWTRQRYSSPKSCRTVSATSHENYCNGNISWMSHHP